MMKPIPADETSDILDEYRLHGVEPVLYPIYPTAESVPQRNEFVYSVSDHQFKVVIGPVRRDDGLMVWRVEHHPDPDDSSPTIFSTFTAAFDYAEEVADRIQP